jgi:hypothetical protein
VSLIFALPLDVERSYKRVREKRSRFSRSPSTKEHLEDCDSKAVHGYLSFALLLQKSGKEDQIDDYIQFFYEWGVPLQIMDLEDDLKNGHYSCPTLGFEKSSLAARRVSWQHSFHRI